MKKESKRNKKGNVPNLRFPGFEGEWAEKKLGELVKIYDGTHQTPNYVTNGIPFYSVEHVTANQFENTKYISKDVFEKENERVRLEKGDILMTRIGSIGVAKYINWDVKASFYVSLALIKQSPRINNEYLCHFINSDFFQSELWKRTIHVAFPQKINLGEIGECYLKHPSLDEQQKIASFLSLIDERIQTQSKIIEKLETLMQSLREQLFTQMLRFKDSNGNEFPNWEVKKGGDVFENISNKEHNSDLPILAITQEQGAIPRDLIQYQISVTDKSVESYKVVEKGDFIISLRSFQGGIEYSSYKGICSPAYIILRNKIEIENLFYKYYFKTASYIKLLNKKLEGIRDGKMISYTYFSEISLPYPCFAEQSQISNFLSTLDEKIQVEKKILKQHQNQKKFLLQNLFI